MEDMELAIKLSDERTLGSDPRQTLIKELSEEVNSGKGRELLQLLNKDAVLHRYPATYTQRSYSHIPGIEAYPPEVSC